MFLRILRNRQGAPVVGIEGVPYSPAVSWDSTQYVEGVLSFATGAQKITIRLGQSVFRNGDYVLFDYSGVGASFPGGQNELTNNVTVDYSACKGITGARLTNDPVNKRIILSLEGGYENSVQYVEGNLNFAGPMTINLPARLFNAAGTYTVFSVTGTTSNLTNAVVVPQNSGLRAGNLYAPTGTGPVYVTLSHKMPSLG